MPDNLKKQCNTWPLELDLSNIPKAENLTSLAEAKEVIKMQADIVEQLLRAQNKLKEARVEELESRLVKKQPKQS